jgi:peptide/nickel transport system permease protein
MKPGVLLIGIMLIFQVSASEILITSFEFDPEVPTPGESVGIAVGVTSGYSEDIEVACKLYVDYQVYQTKTALVPGNSEHIFTFEWRALQGEHFFSAAVSYTIEGTDYSDIVEESLVIEESEQGREYFTEAVLLYRDGDFEKAKLRFQHAEYFFEKDENTKRVKECEEYIEKCEKYIEAGKLFQKGEEEYAMRHYNAAITAYKEAHVRYTELHDKNAAILEQKIQQAQKMRLITYMVVGIGIIIAGLLLLVRHPIITFVDHTADRVVKTTVYIHTVNGIVTFQRTLASPRLRIPMFATKKFVGSIITIVLIMTFLFVLLHSVPGGDAVTRMYGLAPKPIQDQIRREWGLNEPLIDQYKAYLRHVFTLNYKLYEEEELTALDRLLPLLPYTLLLFGTATILSYTIGTLIGIRVIASKNQYATRLITAGSLALYAVPVFVIAIFLRTWLVFKYNIFPPVNVNVSSTATGMIHDAGEITVAIPAMILPLIILVLVGLARPLLLIRDQMSTLAHEPFVTTARAKGLSERAVYTKHVARCAMLPLLNDAAVNLALIVSGSIIIEYIFRWPGIGFALFEALKYLYGPIITCAIFLITVALLVAVFIADVLSAYLDPRVR